MSKERKRDEVLDFAKVYEKLTGEKYDESVQKEIEYVWKVYRDDITYKIERGG